MTLPKPIVADASFAVSAGSTGWAWLVNVNEVLQFVALAVAIVSGIYAIRYHSKDKDEPDSE